MGWQKAGLGAKSTCHPPCTRHNVSRDTVSEAPAPPPCLGLVGEEATFTSAGLYPRHFPRPGSTNTSSSARPICFHRWREDVLPQEFPSSRPLSPVPAPLEGPSSVAVTYLTRSSDARTSMITFHLLTYLFLAMQDIYWEQRRAFCNN